MAEIRKVKRKPRSPKMPKQKQGHKLVWFTLILILIPMILIGYVLVTSLDEQHEPVKGSRFDSADLNPKITEQQMNEIQSQISAVPGVESATMNLKSATLRVHMNTSNEASREEVESIMRQARDIVASVLPFETYFTNTEEGKMYDVEIDSYNWIVDDSHPQDGQIYFKLTKTGAGNEVVDVLSEPKDPDLVNQIVRQ